MLAMKCCIGLDDLPPEIKESAVSIGMFDGVHLGHQALLSALVEEAKRLDAPAVVLTFDRHPAEILSPKNAPLYVTPIEERVELLKAAGADIVVVATFDREMAELEPEEFVDTILVSKLRAEIAVIGSNFRFGRKRVGDVARLRVLGDKRGISVVAVEPVVMRGKRISSTRVRCAIESGDVISAEEFLGRPFALFGTVVHGQEIGRTIGFPTANVEVAKDQIVPGDGVYAVSVEVPGGSFCGVCSIGTRPTVNGKSRTIEVYIIGFDGDIYGNNVCVDFVARLRDEVRFDSLDELKAQIQKDVEKSKEYVANRRENCTSAACLRLTTETRCGKFPYNNGR